MRLLRFIGTQLAKFLTREYIYEDNYFRISIDDIKSALKPGDVMELGVEGLGTQKQQTISD